MKMTHRQSRYIFLPQGSRKQEHPMKNKSHLPEVVRDTGGTVASRYERAQGPEVGLQKLLSEKATVVAL